MAIQLSTARENVFRPMVRRTLGAQPSWNRVESAGVVIFQTPRHPREAAAP